MIWFILVSAAIMAPLLVGWAASLQLSAPDHEGWYRLRPLPTVYAVLLGAAAFSLLLFFVRFFVGSSLPDADDQMFACFLTALGFMILALLLAYNAFWRSVEWKGTTLRVRTLLGSHRHLSFDELKCVVHRNYAGMFDLHFANGQVVKLSIMMKGTGELLKSLPEVTFHERR
jgi:hypothetical protein